MKPEKLKLVTEFKSSRPHISKMEARDVAERIIGDIRNKKYLDRDYTELIESNKDSIRRYQGVIGILGEHFRPHQYDVGKINLRNSNLDEGRTNFRSLGNLLRYIFEVSW